MERVSPSRCENESRRARQLLRELFGNFGWDRKGGSRLIKGSIFSVKFPVEWAVPLKFQTKNSGFCWKMVNRLGAAHTVAYAMTTCHVSAVSIKIFVVQFNSDKCGINHLKTRNLSTSGISRKARSRSYQFHGVIFGVLAMSPSILGRGMSSFTRGKRISRRYIRVSSFTRLLLREMSDSVELMH